MANISSNSKNTLHSNFHPINNDIKILNRYPIVPNQTVLLGVYNNEKLVYMPRRAINIKNLILRHFNKGPLAYTHFTLEELSFYLTHYNWKVLEDTENSTVLRRIEKLAGIMILKKGNHALWNRVSTLTKTRNGKYYLNPSCTEEVFYHLAYNQLTNQFGGKFVKGLQITRLLPNGNVVRPHLKDPVTTSDDVNCLKIDWEYTYHYNKVSKYLFDTVIDRHNPANT